MRESQWDVVANEVADDLATRPWVLVDAIFPSDRAPEEIQRLVDRAGGDEPEGPMAVRALMVNVLLRHLLARVTGMPAEALRFQTGPHGKPSLDGIGDAPFFNVSHTSSHGLIALSRRFELGIDTEAIGNYKERVARRILLSEEFERLQRLDPSARRRLFYKLWTIKEACVKATGAGLSTPLRDVHVELQDSEGRWESVRWFTVDIAEDVCAAAALTTEEDDLGHGSIYSVNAFDALSDVL